jgi:hypothetical protein
MDKLNDTAKKYDMEINVAKTKTMVVSKTGGGKVDIKIEGKKLEQVMRFKYLGSIVTEYGRSLDDVKARIGIAKDAVKKNKEVLTKRVE